MAALLPSSSCTSQLYINPQNQMRQEEEAKAFHGRASEAEEAVITLLIRHLPEAIPLDTLFRLFSHYGASSVRPCFVPKLRNCVFLDFKNEALAYQAHRQLNGLRFLGKVLSVERASNKPTLDSKHKASQAHSGEDAIPPTSLANDATQRFISGSMPASEPIAPRLGVDYPFPPHLEYAYPPPDGNILTNIVNALIAVPRFYTQVLHLMNKMNIPAPFRMALPIPPLPPSLPAPPPPPPPVPAKLHLADLSSDESEMESSDEEINGKAYSVGASALKKYGQKRLKQEVIVGPAADKDVVHEAVGVKPATLVPKEIPLIKKKNYVLQIKIAPKVIQNEQKDDSTEKELEDPDKEGSDIKAYATPEELESRKLPPEEILSLPMFKNYAAGCPASVLYVKNLAKDVIADDFYFIFGSVFGSIDAAKSGLRVKLMQEGRMRGQAFVTFPSVELAHRALNLGNGYVFKGKPMIIQFGRNPVAGKAN
ncbi:U11/U12 small nuclear ribonucleoprotein 65 kDa protein-like isoform X1 [Corylus avellana]|uniref:U11/U12 small nuclear ribonucleoprotein 65 kDa protein-like isoform X1 n=1 Tax=Corylus avellana TaxID=13451 RepID=UPI00286AB833|nr:U11/U12 small nuclear ribonucleoprotein 65 kDa protein-like isoform X1 [Corylus avellana]XP_059463638.1 U11/U12 small nuclear ribonucleoprotein 65 kDa protein-like isoform X1 [Corylus avellana]XP_059463640.1 U11/U12 small nuclear ribonucleoprotein 65 kDa protein-like isoform X1 [Corylus avellana]